MPDDATSADTTTDTTATTADTTGQTFTQEQVNTFLAEQKRKIGNVSQLKADAAELATIKDAQKSTEQKAADRQSAADAQIATIPAKVSEALRVHLVALHKIPAEDAELFLTASDPEVLLKQVERLVARGAEDVAASKKHGNFVAREGSTSHSADSDELQTTRELFGSP